MVVWTRVVVVGAVGRSQILNIYSRSNLQNLLMDVKCERKKESRMIDLSGSYVVVCIKKSSLAY